MGVSYYTCKNSECRSNFPDCSDDCVWCECGGHFCSSECGQMDYRILDDEGEEMEEEGPGTCILCRGEEATDAELIEWLLERCKLNRDAALLLMFKENGPYACKHNIPSYLECETCSAKGCFEG